MLDTHARKYVNPVIDMGANIFLKLKLTPNKVTLLALFIGIITSILLFFGNFKLAVFMLWFSGYLDSVDGAMARILKKTTLFGTLLDIVSDRVVEISIILVLGYKYSDARFYLMILLGCIILSMTVFLTVGALTEKKGMKSFYYQAGVAERSEGFIFFSLMMLFPNALIIITNIFSALIFITVVQRFLEAKKILD